MVARKIKLRIIRKMKESPQNTSTSRPITWKKNWSTFLKTWNDPNLYSWYIQSLELGKPF